MADCVGATAIPKGNSILHTFWRVNLLKSLGLGGLQTGFGDLDPNLQGHLPIRGKSY
jgi:hypothetical protein